jgi:hypothetical protein
VKLTRDLPADVFDADFTEDAFARRVRELALKGESRCACCIR